MHPPILSGPKFPRRSLDAPPQGVLVRLQKGPEREARMVAEVEGLWEAAAPEGRREGREGPHRKAHTGGGVPHRGGGSPRPALILRPDAVRLNPGSSPQTRSPPTVVPRYAHGMPYLNVRLCGRRTRRRPSPSSPPQPGAGFRWGQTDLSSLPVKELGGGGWLTNSGGRTKGILVSFT